MIESQLKIIATKEAEESARADLNLNEPQKLTAEEEKAKLEELLRANS